MASRSTLAKKRAVSLIDQMLRDGLLRPEDIPKVLEPPKPVGRPRASSALTEEEIRKMYRSGVGITYIRKIDGSSVTRIYRILGEERERKNGRPTSRSSKLRYAEIIEEYTTSGASMQAIATKYGVTRQRIHQLLKSAGVSGRLPAVG